MYQETIPRNRIYPRRRLEIRNGCSRSAEKVAAKQEKINWAED